MQADHTEEPRLIRRGGLLAGGFAAALAAVLGRPKSVGADINPGPYVVLGARNDEKSTTSFVDETGAQSVALAGEAPNGGIGLLGLAGINDVSLSNPSDISAGLWAYGAKGAFGSWSQAVGMPGALAISDKIGVLGVAGLYEDVPKVGDIRSASWFYSRDYYGSWNQSQNSIGSLSMSERSVGAVATSGSPYSQAEIAALDPAGFHAAAAGETPALCAAAQAGAGVIGMSKSQVGVIGTTGDAYSEAELAALDAAGIHAAAKGTTPALCAQADAGPGAIGMSTSHIGVIGTSGGAYSEQEIAALDGAGIHAAAKGATTAFCAAADTGVAIEAMSAGVGLRVMGTIESEHVHSGTIRSRQSQAFVQCNGVTADSHVQVTFTSDPGKANAWVERQPGKGFVVHLTDTAKGDVSFTVSMVNPIQ